MQHPILLIWLVTAAGIFFVWSSLQLQAGGVNNAGESLGRWVRHLPKGLFIYSLLWPIAVIWLLMGVARRWIRGAQGKD